MFVKRVTADACGKVCMLVTVVRYMCGVVCVSLGHGLWVLLCEFVGERMLGSRSHVWLYILGDWVIHVVPEVILCLFVFLFAVKLPTSLTGT